MNLNKLTTYLLYFDNGVRLSISEMDDIYRKLSAANCYVSQEDHIKSINKTNDDIRNHICPRCGGNLVLRNGKNGAFYGCSNYPKCKFTKNKSNRIN